ncbi:hypothetical protein [Sodalis ligni]|uniref:hypothetical protein n=1 Tax=Sodalis ligni TaxID=2697027 RepID=UPI00104F8961|nr:hypothetical protein [Sodalis ligni]
MSRQLARIESLSWHLPAPKLLGLGPDLRLFITGEDASHEGAHQQKYAIKLFPDRMVAEPLLSEDGFSRWLPEFGDTPPTLVQSFPCRKASNRCFGSMVVTKFGHRRLTGSKRDYIANLSSIPLTTLLFLLTAISWSWSLNARCTAFVRCIILIGQAVAVPLI